MRQDGYCRIIRLAHTMLRHSDAGSVVGSTFMRCAAAFGLALELIQQRKYLRNCWGR